MIEWFTEDSFFPACIGILLAIAFVGLAFSSGETVMLKVGLGVAALTALLVGTEIFIVTDKEQIEGSLYEMADAMRKNEFERVYDFLERDELVQRARAHLHDATCHTCNITAVNSVEIEEGGQKATADFVAFAKASNQHFPKPTAIQRRIKLHFKRVKDDWKITDFETADPRAGLNL